MYINVHLQSMEHHGTFDRIQCQDVVVLAVLSILSILSTTHTNYHWLRACTGNSFTLHIYAKVFHDIEKG